MNFNTVNTIALGSVGVTVSLILAGCESQQPESNINQNKFLVIEKNPGGTYTVIEEMPTDGPTRAIIREKDANGNITERFMSEEEMKVLAEQEYQKFQSGQSELNQDQSGNAGMGLAGTILAVAAGSLLGNMVGNALMNNSNFRRNSANVNKSAYSRSASSTSSKSGTSNSKKSFFGSKSGSSSSYGSRTYGS